MLKPHSKAATSATADFVLGTPIAEYATPKVAAGCDFTLSAKGPSANLQHIALVSFQSLSVSGHPGSAWVFFFPLDFEGTGGPEMHLTMHRFSTPANAVANMVCVGQTGRRAVWMERRWDTDNFRLMKATFHPSAEEPPVVKNLLPPNVALPFETHTCQSMAFDETTGRLYLGLHTGELYILEL